MLPVGVRSCTHPRIKMSTRSTSVSQPLKPYPGQNVDPFEMLTNLLAGPTTASAVMAAAAAATEMWLARQMASVATVTTDSKGCGANLNNNARSASPFWPDGTTSFLYLQTLVRSKKPLVKVRAPHHLLKSASASSSSNSRRSSAPPLTRNHLQVFKNL